MTSLTVLALSLGAVVVNHFAKRSLPGAELSEGSGKGSKGASTLPRKQEEISEGHEPAQSIRVNITSVHRVRN